MAICSFSIAVNKRKKGKNGEWEDKVSYFECSYFGKAAEGVSQYLVKGQQVSIQGSLDQQTWENNGQKRSKVVVIVNSLSLLGSNKATQGAQGYNQPTTPQNQNRQPQGQYQGQAPNNYQDSQTYQQDYQGGPEDFADDIPF
jgi:single-strand DNA-binding protein